MAWQYLLIGVAISVAVGLIVPYIRRRYIDAGMTRCVICGTRHKEYSRCPECGGR